MSGQEKKLNASQRLETLEVQNQELVAAFNNMARDFQIMREAIKLMGNKLDAVQKAAGVSDDQVSALMIDNNAAELKEKVDGFVAQGVLQAAESVTEQTFLVGQEVNDDGAVVNKRIQFATGALKPELREKLLGCKVGDKVQFSEGTLLLEINEIYAIVSPEAPQTADEAALDATAEAPSEA